jgi:uncharacterized protein YdaU (DUF1376 family)
MARTVDHYIPFFGRDFYASTAMWTAEEVGHYIRLLVIQWDSGGLPAELERLELVSPGVRSVWPLLSSKFPVCDDGLRRNSRMEAHREKAEELKDARSEAGQEGNRKRWGDRKTIANGSQTDRKRIANGVANCSQDESYSAHSGAGSTTGNNPNLQNGEDRQGGSQTDRKAIANGIAKTSPPSPSPSPSPIPSPAPSQNENTHTHGDGENEFRKAGWAAEEWAAFVSSWNQSERAEPWLHLTPPDGWIDLAATPGWLQHAHEALAMLPSREYFDRPLPVTRFFTFVDRIRAGEFADPKDAPRGRARKPVGGNL